jgi:predicted aldo/keto reductase-like oxidoreductase
MEEARIKNRRQDMLKATLGRTELTVNKDGFGALPIQRDDMDTACKILRKALDNGIDFFDTARAYSDSEEKIGKAISPRRSEFTLATKTGATTVEGFWKDLETSLSLLKTDHIDIYQFHNIAKMPRPDDGSGLYEAMCEAKKQGKIRFIGITNHRIAVAEEVAESGLYDTLQFPFSYLATEREITLVKKCEEKRVGFLCMKALSGGLITDIAAARGWLARYKNTVPIFGIQREKELDQLLACKDRGDELTRDDEARIDKDRAELMGDFCRGCGYCMPCPQGIQINQCARISLMVRRAPSSAWLNDYWQAEMKKVATCKHCNQCKAKCPYGLDTPTLLQKNLADYEAILRGEKSANVGLMANA